jgi:NADPH-dependent 2,4-dienoyl-CoA reductase/sulfur reductase-like enzyme
LKLDGIDLAIIGGGPAGMAAAVRAKESGLERVVIIERGEYLGGLLDQCIHNGFGLFYFKDDLTGPEYGARFETRIKELGIEVLLESMVIELRPDREIVAVNRKGYFRTQPRAVVLAMGCRERARGSLAIAGTRPAGIFTAGTAQRLVNIEGYIPGKEIVILGSGDIGMIMARRLTLESAKVKAVVEKLPYTGGLIRNQVQCLADFEIPLLLSHTVTYIQGKDRIQAVEVSRVDEKGEVIPGTEKLIECDTLLLSVGLIPENELSQMAGIELDPLTGGPLMDEYYQTTAPGIFAGGNVVQVHDLVDNVSWQAERAGEYAARFVAQEGLREKARITLRPGRNIKSIVPQKISTKEDVEIYLRVERPEKEVRVHIPGVERKGFRIVTPSESIKIKLSAEKLKKVTGEKEMVIDCLPKKGD